MIHDIDGVEWVLGLKGGTFDFESGSEPEGFGDITRRMKTGVWEEGDETSPLIEESRCVEAGSVEHLTFSAIKA